MYTGALWCDVVARVRGLNHASTNDAFVVGRNVLQSNFYEPIYSVFRSVTFPHRLGCCDTRAAQDNFSLDLPEDTSSQGLPEGRTLAVESVLFQIGSTS